MTDLLTFIATWAVCVGLCFAGLAIVGLFMKVIFLEFMSGWGLL